MAHSGIKKVVLAYSGGLDTSIIVKWLQDEYRCEVVTFTADIGQGEEVEPARAKAEAAGIEEIYIEDLREEFARDFVFPMFRANALYEGEYLLGTSIARPLISKRLVEIAEATGGPAITLVFSVMLTAFAAWYFPRALLYVVYERVTPLPPGRHRRLRRWVPRLLGVLPILSIAVAYARLREFLGLPVRPIRVYDPIQQLAVVAEGGEVGRGPKPLGILALSQEKAGFKRIEGQCQRAKHEGDTQPVPRRPRLFCVH